MQLQEEQARNRELEDLLQRESRRAATLDRQLDEVRSDVAFRTGFIGSSPSQAVDASLSPHAAPAGAATGTSVGSGLGLGFGDAGGVSGVAGSAASAALAAMVGGLASPMPSASIPLSPPADVATVSSVSSATAPRGSVSTWQQTQQTARPQYSQFTHHSQSLPPSRSQPHHQPQSQSQGLAHPRYSTVTHPVFPPAPAVSFTQLQSQPQLQSQHQLQPQSQHGVDVHRSTGFTIVPAGASDDFSKSPIQNSFQPQAGPPLPPEHQQTAPAPVQAFSPARIQRRTTTGDSDCFGRGITFRLSVVLGPSFGLTDNFGFSIAAGKVADQIYRQDSIATWILWSAWVARLYSSS
jgi:hypothetical protein